MPAAGQRGGLIRAVFLYFGIVLGTGFLLGMVRVPFVVPRLGERWAELGEMPIMGIAIFLAAGLVLRRFSSIHAHGPALVVGVLALALLAVAELALAVALQDQTVVEYLASRDPISGAAYLGMLVVFALMPWLRLHLERLRD
jgi:hypothetical protein